MMKPEEQKPKTGQPETPGKPFGTAQDKPYTPPAILHELELETRAGSPLGVDPFDVGGAEGVGW